MELNENLDDSPRIKPENLSDFACRICFEPQSDDQQLISPCKCNGSMKYIHEECLKIWLISQDKDLSESECDVCKTKFLMKTIVATKCTCKNYWNECLGMFIFPVLLVLMSSILMVILLFLVQGIQNHESSAGEQTYLILLVFACFIIIVIIFVIFVKSIRRGCFSTEMISWTIESQTFEEHLEDTIEHNNHTIHVEDTNIMVIPKISRLNGRNIIRPEILTPRLLPIMRSGELIGYRPRAVTARSMNSSQALNISQGLDLSASFGTKIVPMP